MQKHPQDFRGLRDLDQSSDGSTRLLGLAIFALIAGLVLVDLVSDARSGIALEHLVLEGSALVLALAGIAFLLRDLRRTRRRARLLSGEVATSREEAEHWRRETRDLLAGLSAAIDQQFEIWQLSPAEREIGLLLIKGFSLKEIALLRSTSERTTRQQAQSVYRKAALSSRAELAAFFLEDLLLPDSLARQR